MPPFAQSYGALMKYLKSLFYHFLIVFFANYTMPGIEVIRQTKLPHIGADIFFALVLGFLNSLIFPVLKVVDEKINVSRIAIVCISLSFVSYAILKFAPLGVEVKSVEGYLFAAFTVALGSFLMNYFEMRDAFKFPRPPEMPKI
jgi:hypothetical protein